MKHAKTRSLSLALAIALILALTPTALLADSTYYGSEVWLQDADLQNGVVYHDNIFWSNTYNNFRHEHYFTYTPGAAVRPVAAYGTSVCNRASTLSAARAYESQGYRVVGGINGDFFDMSIGWPLGVVASGGRLLSDCGGHYAVGFRGDGSVVLGKPQISVTAAANGAGLTFAGLNKPRVEGGGTVLLSYEFRTDHTTGTSTSGLTALATVTGGTQAVGGTLEVLVDEVVEDAERKTLGPDQVALTVSSASSDNSKAFVQSLHPGDTVTIAFHSRDTANDWSQVTEAIGAMYLLVDGGVAQSGLPSGANPYTAVGVTADGEVVFYTVDGRQSGVSAGATLHVMAQRLVEMGCVTALGLDGGGSTSAVAALPGQTTAALLNSPSDGAARSVTDSLLLLAPGQATGVPGDVYLSASAPAALTGHTVKLTAGLVDTNYLPMDGEITLEASAGSVSGDTLTLPAEGGAVTVTASSGELSDQVSVLALEQPDAASIQQGGKSINSLTVKAGGAVQLGIAASYRHRALAASAGDFTWTADPAVGTVDANGVFTAGPHAGSGRITASRGSFSVSVNVTVQSRFTDVNKGAYYYDAVEWAVDEGVTTGVTDSTFVPGRACTRAEIVTFLWRASGSPEPASADSPFADVSDSGYYRKAVLWAVEQGITKGTSDSAFSPDGTCTRAQAVTFLYRAAGQPAVAGDGGSFSDVNNTAYYADAVTWAVERGITNGRGANTFAPNADCTRADIVTFLYRDLA